MRNRASVLAGAALLALTIPALAQQAQNAVDPTRYPEQPEPRPTPTADPVSAADQGAGEVAVVDKAALVPPPEPVEYPDWAKRDPWEVGPLTVSDAGLGTSPWGGSDGRFLMQLMRLLDTPLASRWTHIALRDALLARSRAPRGVHPVDWVAERAWLLLRMGEADAARLLVAGVDTTQFTPKMTQVAVQSALADADPPALCPLEEKLRRYEPGIRPMVSAMCSSLAGEPQVAAAQIDDARRFGRIGGIDLRLAEKVVGAGSNTGRTTTIEWEPVEAINAWRFGLATATGIVIPEKLMDAGSPQLRAFQARAALLEPQARLASAYIAAGLGVFSSQSLVDLHSAIYDSTDPSDLPDSDSWQLRQAFAGKDQAARLAGIRHFLAMDGDSLTREGARSAVARAASRIAPNPDYQDDAPGLISAMIAAGFDRAAVAWAGAAADMDDVPGDRTWAMIALAAPPGSNVDIGSRRINAFIDRDESAGKIRSALLVAGLAGLGKIDRGLINNLNRRHQLGLERTSNWTRMIRGAADRGQSGTVRLLAATGMQTDDWEKVPPAQLMHALLGLKRTGQDFQARMIAAEALSRT